MAQEFVAWKACLKVSFKRLSLKGDLRSLHWPLRERARSHIWNAFPCRSEPALEGAVSAIRKLTVKNPLFKSLAKTGRLLAVAVSLLWASKVCLKRMGW
jgi:hypothetical protein